MQVDAPPEENENIEEEHYVVENTSFVSSGSRVEYVAGFLLDFKVLKLKAGVESRLNYIICTVFSCNASVCEMI